MGRPFKCPYCGSTDTASKGVRRTKTMGDRTIRRCKGCGRKFTPQGQPPQDTYGNTGDTATPGGDSPAVSAEPRDQPGELPAHEPEWTS